MTTREWHKAYDEEFEDATLAAHGAIMGWMSGKGQTAPHLTEDLIEAYRGAFAEAFNAGVEVGLRHDAEPAHHLTEPSNGKARP